MQHDHAFEELVELFTQTGKAHHKAFIETDGSDPEWPLWYADYLHSKLTDMLEASFTKSELVYMLVMLDKERAIQAPGSIWQRYNAKYFVDSYL